MRRPVTRCHVRVLRGHVSWQTTFGKEKTGTNAHGHVYVQADTAEVHSEMEVVILTAEGDPTRMTREVKRDGKP